MSNQSRDNIGRNTAWNAAAQLAPVVSAAIALPFLARGLGEERLGVLLLVWTIVSLASVLDLGVGRALTQMIAVRRGSGTISELNSIVRAGVGLSGLLGLSVGALVLATSSWLTSSMPDMTSWISEARASLLLVGLSLPFLLLSNSLRATLDGLEQFELSARVRIPIGILTFILPVALLPFTKRVDLAVATLLTVRCAGSLVLGVVVTRLLSAFPTNSQNTLQPLKELLRLGGWVSVSNLASIILVYADRFLIVSIVSVAAVAHYTTASEIVTRLLLVPIAVAAVWFPALARTQQRAEDEQRRHLNERGVRFVTIVTLPILILLVAMADPILRLWAGSEIADPGAPVLQWLSMGVFMNALAQIPFATLHARARPDAPALLHLIELPLYLALLWWALPSFGLVGAAIAWTARAGFDFLGLLILTARLESNFSKVAQISVRLASEGIVLLLITLVLSRSLGPWLGALILAPVCSAWLWERVLITAWRTEISDRIRQTFC